MMQKKISHFTISHLRPAIKRFYSLESKETLRNLLQKRLDLVKTENMHKKSKDAEISEKKLPPSILDKQSMIKSLEKKIDSTRAENLLLSSQILSSNDDNTNEMSSKITLKKTLASKLDALKEENIQLQKETSYKQFENISDDAIKTKFVNQNDNNPTNIYILNKNKQSKTKKSYFKQQKPFAFMFSNQKNKNQQWRQKEKPFFEEKVVSDEQAASQAQANAFMMTEIARDNYWKEILFCFVCFSIATGCIFYTWKTHKQYKLVKESEDEETDAEIERLEKEIAKEIDAEIERLQKEIAKEERFNKILKKSK